MTSYSPPDYSPPTPRPPDLPPPEDRPYFGGGPPWYVAVAGVVLLAILALVVVILVRGDDDQQIETALPTTTSTTEPPTTASSATTSTVSSTTQTSASSTSGTATTVSSTTTTAPTTTTTATTTTTIDPNLYLPAVWPWFDSGVRYVNPMAAARGFAEDSVGFDNPVVGPFQQGDSRSGEVEVRPTADGPVTVVLVRQLGPDDTWWVLGSATANIEVDEPDALDEISSPLTVSGRALAFEGTVDVEVRGDGSTSPLVAGFVTGGGTEMAPFEGTFTFTSPGQGGGAVVFLTLSAENGQVWEAAVVRVQFAGQ